MNKELHIVLPPHLLDANINSHILDKAKSTYENKSILEIGYIIQIQTLNKIIHTYIDKLSNNVVVVGDFHILSSNPRKGDVVKNCRVHLIMNHGIFLKHYNIDILIPNLQLQNYTYSQKTFVHKNTKKVITEGDFLDVMILDRRFSQNEFSCIGKINI